MDYFFRRWIFTISLLALFWKNIRCAQLKIERRIEQQRVNRYCCVARLTRSAMTTKSLISLFTKRRSVVKNVNVWCFQWRLFVCLFVCQHDNFRTSKHRMMKLGGRCIVHNSRISLDLEVIAPPPGAHPQNVELGYDLGKISAGFPVIHAYRLLILRAQTFIVQDALVGRTVGVISSALLYDSWGSGLLCSSMAALSSFLREALAMISVWCCRSCVLRLLVRFINASRSATFNNTLAIFSGSSSSSQRCW